VSFPQKGQKTTSVKNKIPSFDAETPVSEINNVSIQHGTASFNGQFKKDTGAYSTSLLTASIKNLIFLKPHRFSYSASSKSYLSHIYPFHNFW
jgi:hypothetical protein